MPISSRIYYNRFVIVFNFTNTEPHRYDEFRSECKRLGQPYSFGPNWLLLKSPRTIDDIIQSFARTMDTMDRLLVLELEHGKRPTQHRITPQKNFSQQDREFLETF